MKRIITGKLALLSLILVAAVALRGGDITIEYGTFHLTNANTSLEKFEVVAIGLTFSTEVPLFLKVKPNLLQSGGDYTFQIGTPDVFADGFPISIKKIYDGDKLLYDETVCILHNIKMQREELPIRYGMLAERDDEYERFLDSFPYGRDFIPGGCVVMEDSPKNDWAFVCPVCRKNYLEWKKREDAVQAAHHHAK